MDYNFNSISGKNINVDNEISLIEWIRKSCKKFPNDVAVIESDSGLKATYNDIDKLSDNIAWCLLNDLGVERLSKIGICEENNINRLVSILGIMKAGGVYVPLDPNYPESRLKMIAEISELEAVICTEKFGSLIEHHSPKIFTDKLVKLAKESNFEKVRTDVHPNDPVHLLFTSGTTGVPKGVLGSNKSIINRFKWAIEEFPIKRDDVFCLKTSLNFIPSVWEMFGPLVCGVKLVLIKAESVSNVTEFIEALDKHSVSRLILVPTLLSEVLDYIQTTDNRPNTLKLWMTSGEKLSSSLVDKFYNVFPKCELVNIYGSTEIEDGLFYRVNRNKLNTLFTPIGKPIANSEVLIINEDNLICETDEVGEICFKGPGVATSYINGGQIEERFIKLAEYRGEAFFRTGDYGKISASGDVEIIGRTDNQVKFLGNRFDLTEVEESVKSCVKSSHVVAKLDEKNSAIICYYVPSENRISPTSIRTELLEKLPVFMVPVRFIELKYLPLTPNGKVDRLALPIVDLRVRTLDAVAISPSNKVQEKIVEIFESILGVFGVGIKDNFFELGGDSLKFTRLLVRLRESLNVNFDLAEIRVDPTPFTIEGVYSTKTLMESNSQLLNVDMVDKGDITLSEQQRRLWTQQEILGLDSSVLNLVSLLKFPHGCKKNTIINSVKKLLLRHTILSKRVKLDNGKHTLAPSDTAVLAPDIRIFNDQRCLDAYITNRSEEPLKVYDNLASLEVLDDGKDLYLFVRIHHLIFDGASLGVLLNELSSIVRAESHSRDTLLEKSFNSYNQLSNIDNNSINKHYLTECWSSYLDGYDGLLELPTDHARSNGLKVGRANRASKYIQGKSAELVTALATKLGVTPYVVYLSAFYLLLSKYTGKSDIVIGVPTDDRQYSCLENAIGFFVNTLPVRIQLDGTESILQLIENVAKSSIEAENIKQLPFDDIVAITSSKPELGQNPLYDVMFTYQSMELNDSIPEQERISWQEIGNGYTDVDLSLIIQPIQFGRREFVIEYNSEIFSTERIESFFEHYMNIVEFIHEEIGANVSEVEYISEQDKKSLLFDLNDTKKSRVPVNSLYSLFETKAYDNLDKIAVRDQRSTLSYSQLIDEVNLFSLNLKEQGVTGQSYVGVSVERNSSLIVTMLAIWKIGAIYLPLSPDLPIERVNYILEDTGAKFIVTSKNIISVVDEKNSGHVTNIIIEDFFRDYKPTVIDNVALETDVAYVMYTSGSTGKPKGVTIRNSSIVDRVFSLCEFYEYSNSSKHLQYGSYSFDTSLEELLLPIMSGGELVFAPLDLTYDPKEIISLVNKHGITVINFIPSLLKVIIDYVESRGTEGLESLKYIISGAETLTPDIVKKFYRSLNECKLFNSYGPTENTIDSTLHLCSIEDGDKRSVPIGKCVDNSSCYVLDKSEKLVPFGVPGTLFVGGAGLSSGYLNRQELTNEKFITNPYKVDETIYNTGDLVQIERDGTISFIGRADSQVKVRGHRIELGEIEISLKNCDGVSHAIVVTRQSDKGETNIYAYITTNLYHGPEVSSAVLKNQLKEKLPNYMIPTNIIIVGDFPYLPSGKIDTTRLPSPFTSFESDNDNWIDESASDTEKRVYEIWEELLGTTGFGRDQSFMAAGGSSILAIRMVNLLRDRIGKNVSLKDFYSSPTISEISKCVDSSELFLSKESTSKQLSVNEAPLTSCQERLWFLDTMNEHGIENVIPIVMLLEGTLDTERLFDSCLNMYNNNVSLRANFKDVGGNVTQYISDHEIDFKVVDASINDELIKKQICKPFDIRSEPLIRFLLIRESVSKYAFVITQHHIISDGWSSDKLLLGISRNYNGVIKKGGVRTNEMDYFEYALNERDNDTCLQDTMDYWNEVFEVEQPVLQLPLDKHRPSKQSFDGDSISITISGDDFSRLNNFSRDTDFSLFQLFITSYFILLKTYTNQSDITVGTVMANRNDSNHEDIIGFFANTLPVRMDIDFERSFVELLSLMKENLSLVTLHQSTPFSDLVKSYVGHRDKSINPIFQTMFVMQDVLGNSLSLEEIKGTPVEVPHYTSKFDLSVLSNVDSESVRFVFEYNSGLFNKSTIAGMMETYVNILMQCADKCSKNISSFNFLSDNDLEVIDSYNQTEKKFYKGDLLLDQLCWDSFRSYKDKVAIISGDRSITYDELDMASSQVAVGLINRGVKSNDLVAVVMDKSWEQIVAVLSILKAGGAYLPINVMDPNSRIQEVLDCSGCIRLLTQSRYLDKVDCFDKYDVMDIGDHIDFSGGYVQVPTRIRTQDDIAYVIFTSGSTGKPKGVTIKHKAVVNTILDVNSTYRISDSDVVYGLSGLNFDLSVYDIFGSLSVGATLVLPRENSRKDPECWYQDVSRHSVTFWNSVPALKQMFCDYITLNGLNGNISSINNVLLSGDWIPLDLPRKINECFDGNVNVTSLGGATEASIWSISYEISDVNQDWNSIPYGKPMANQKFHVLNDNLFPVPINAPGELYIGGIGLASGYWNDESRTTSSFIYSPHHREMLYKTGDLGRLKSDGNIEFLGRNDQQVKIRGYRIELGEVQSKLKSLPSVEDAVVVSKLSKDNNFYLIAYVVTLKNDILDEENIRVSLRDLLPEYMIPSLFVSISAIPLSANGKVDKKQLPSYDYISKPIATSFTPSELIVASIWEEILNKKIVNNEENFFEIGGHSLLATKAAFLLGNAFNVKVPISLVFECSILHQLAIALSELVEYKSNDIEIEQEFIEEGEL